jgi:hypothetical protein
LTSSSFYHRPFKAKSSLRRSPPRDGEGCLPLDSCGPRATISADWALFHAANFSLELHPLPDPNGWQSIADPWERLQVGLTQLYQWFEASEPVMTNSVRDFGAVQESAEAMHPVGEAFQRIYETLCRGWERSRVSPLLSLAVDFATWKKLRREQGMASRAIVEMWSDLIRCWHPEPGNTPVRC